MSDIRQAFDTKRPNGLAEVCVLDRGRWTASGIFNGSLLSLFPFRPKGWQTGEADDLQFKLTQVAIHVWKVAFERDGTELPVSKADREFQ